MRQHIEQGESNPAADLWRRYLREAEVKLRTHGNLPG
jgi:hypothetical protein